MIIKLFFKSSEYVFYLYINTFYLLPYKLCHQDSCSFEKLMLEQQDSTRKKFLLGSVLYLSLVSFQSLSFDFKERIDS